MAKVFFMLIKRLDDRTIEDVPLRIRAEVQALLDEAGLDGNGELIE